MKLEEQRSVRGLARALCVESRHRVRSGILSRAPGFRFRELNTAVNEYVKALFPACRHEAVAELVEALETADPVTLREVGGFLARRAPGSGPASRALCGRLRETDADVRRTAARVLWEMQLCRFEDAHPDLRSGDSVKGICADDDSGTACRARIALQGIREVLETRELLLKGLAAIEKAPPSGDDLVRVLEEDVVTRIVTAQGQLNALRSIQAARRDMDGGIYYQEEELGEFAGAAYDMTDEEVEASAVQILKRSAKLVISGCVEMLARGGSTARRVAVAILQTPGVDCIPAFRTVLRALSGPDGGAGGAAGEAQGDPGEGSDPEETDFLEALRAKDPTARWVAAIALGHFRDLSPEAEEALLAALDDADPVVQAEALISFVWREGELGGRFKIKTVALLGTTSSPVVREAAITVLDREFEGVGGAVSALAGMLRDGASTTRLQAARALGAMGLKAMAAAPQLRDLSLSEGGGSGDLRQAAAEALRRIEAAAEALKKMEEKAR